MKDEIEEMIKKSHMEYSKIIEDFIKESVFNYSIPKLKIKGEITQESIGKKLQWRGIKLINYSCNSKVIMVVTQRNIIISRLMLVRFPDIFISRISHPFFRKDFRNEFKNIREYLGVK
jgi:hypothetical protein